MTYCVGILVDDGLVMVGDTRTNAGVDNVSIYKKLHLIADTPERTIFLASAGNLSVTQSVLAMLTEGLPPLEEGAPPRTPEAMPTMFRVAQLVGEAVAIARRTIGAALADTRINAAVGLLVGGRIGDALHLFLVYNEGNFIECQPDAPFLQIGEFKYGKPILDRALAYDSRLDEAVKCAFISFDSTIRSNLSVGLPLDLIVMPRDPARAMITRRIEADDTYFDQLSAEWGRLLNESRAVIPDPPFMRVAPTG